MNTLETKKTKQISELVMELQALEQDEAELQRKTAHIQGKRWRLYRRIQDLLNGENDLRLF